MSEKPNFSEVSHQDGRRWKLEQKTIEENLANPNSYNPDRGVCDALEERSKKGHPAKRDSAFNETVPRNIEPPLNLGINIKDYDSQNRQEPQSPPPVSGIKEDGTLGIDFRLPQ